MLQILEMNPEDEAEEDGANIDLDSQRKGKCVVLKTSTRQVIQFIFILYIYNTFLRTHVCIMTQHKYTIYAELKLFEAATRLSTVSLFVQNIYCAQNIPFLDKIVPFYERAMFFCGFFRISVIYISWGAKLLVFILWQTIFLPVVGLVDPDKLKPGDLVGVNKDSYLILDTLPSEYDSRVKAMEVDEKPTEDYNDIGGLEKQV